MTAKIVQVNIGPTFSYVASKDPGADMNNGFFGIKYIIPAQIVWNLEDPCLNIIASELEITVQEILDAYEKWRKHE